ncbi:MAG: hypothetical protein HKN75_03825 [Bacteroidia bacterium]|nr:hypothetical protein [Bacteroidia bacterium]
MIRISILAFIFLCFSIPAICGERNIYSDNCIEAQHLIFDLKLDKAEELLSKEESQNPTNILTIRLRSYIDFLKAFISEEQYYYERFEENTETRLDFLSSNFQDSPLNKMIQAEIALQLSVTEFQNEEYISSAWDLRKSYRLFVKNKEEHPDFIENNVGLGLMHALIGATPDKYKWLMNIAGMKGDLNTGLKELNEVYKFSIANNLSPLTEEVSLIRLLTELHINKDFENANVIAESLIKESHKTLILFSLSHYYMNTGNTDKAYDLLQNNNFSKDRFPFLYLYFMRGTAGLYQLNLSKETYDDMNLFTSKYKGFNFIKAAYQKKAWFKFLRGDTASYKNMLQLCLTKGNDFTDEDKQAIVEAKSGNLPNVNILKARILFDGGYYDKAKALLEAYNENNFTDFKSKVEYNYRLARTLDKLNEDEQSIVHYLKTIDNSIDKPWYYAANSSYFLGRYYEEKKDYTNAKLYYSKCFEIDNTEYRNSIRQKAKTGLNRIKNK